MIVNYAIMYGQAKLSSVQLDAALMAWADLDEEGKEEEVHSCSAANALLE